MREIVQKQDGENAAWDEPSPADAKLERCQKIIGYEFRDIGIFAFRFDSFERCVDSHPSNERMEFLGDSILGMIVCESLFRKYPEYLEGELTKIKSIVVSRRVLCQDI